MKLKIADKFIATALEEKKSAMKSLTDRILQ